MNRKDYEKLYSTMTTKCIDSFKRDDSVILAEEAEVFDEGFSAEFPSELLEHFKTEILHLYWFYKYPHLFDRADLWTGCTIQRKRGNHFGEWLGAIILNQHYGYKSLIEKYDCPGEHREKVAPARLLLGNDVYQTLINNKNQPPDLLMYDDIDYCFYEVKRRSKNKKEKLTPNQSEYFTWLKNKTGHKVHALSLAEI